MFDHASINRAYQLVWSDRLQAYVPAAETAKVRRSGGRRVARGAAATLLAALSTTGVLHAQTARPPTPTQLPAGGTVAAGQAGIAQSGARMDITQTTQRAAIDWQTFNVGSQAHVNFNQPSAQSVTLNRVLDAQPSQIFGRITSNGQLFLSNPNGVYFSPGASVDVGGLVATTHSMSNAEFMAGKTTFTRNGSNAAVVNQGLLRANLGGYIALLAPEVRNEGVIVAQAGTVAMASGESITLNFGGTHNLTGITVTASQIQAQVDNKHAVLARGGLVILSAHAADRLRGGVVNNSGVIEAQGIVQRAGRIVLEASDSVHNSGTARADSGSAGSAGRIHVTARDIVNSGTLSAAKTETIYPSVQPVGGGEIALRATHSLTQTPSGRSDVSADQAGGITLKADYDIGVQGAVLAGSTSGIGGDIRIQAGPTEPALPGAPTTPSTVTIANAELRTRSTHARGGMVTVEGDTLHLSDNTVIDARGGTGGGTVLVGGDWQGGGTLRQATQVAMARGATIDASATREGDGGKVVLWSDIHHRQGETVFHGRIDALGAGAGAGGRVETSGHALSAAGRVNAGRGGQWLIDPYNITIENSPSAGGVINAAAIVASLNGGAEVIVTTSGAGTEAGDMTLNADLITGALPNDTKLTLHAHRNIVINNGYSIDATQNGNTKKLNVVLWANAAGTGGGIEMGSNTAIRSNGGNIVLGGGTNIATGYASGASSYEGGRGIWLREGTVLNAAGGNITLRGQGRDGGEGIVLGDPGADPVDPGSSLLITHGSGAIQLYGTGTTAVPGAHTTGIKLFHNVRIQTQQGAIQLEGRGGDSLSTGVDNSGIVFGPGSRVLSASGPISFTGTVGNGSSTSGSGIRFESGTNHWGHDGGANLTASASAITLNADAWRSDSATTVINTTGALTLRPISASFSDTLNWSGNVSSGDYTGTGSMSGFVINQLQSLGGLTVGKTGNTSDIIISSPLRVDGPVTLIGQSIALNEEVRTDGHALTLTATASATQSERLRVASLLLNGPGDYTLDHSDNRIGTLAANVGSGSVVVKNDQPLAIGSVQGISGVTSYNTVHVETSAGQALTVNQPVSGPSPTLIAGGDLVLNAPLTATTSDLLLVAGGAFVNNAGANALDANGRWLVYSTSPDANTFGGLASGNMGLFGKRFSDYGPADVVTDGYGGHRFVFSDVQNIAVTTLNATNVYGAPPVPLSNHYNVSPLSTYGGAILAPTLSGTPIISSAGSSSSANAGAYAVNADVSGMHINAMGYNVVAVNQGILTVTPRPVSLTGARVYDATAAINAEAMLLGNIVNGDLVSLNGSGALSSKDVGTRSLGGVGTLALSNNNYTLSGATTAFNITPASVTVSGVAAQHKVYDTNTTATLVGVPTVAALGSDVVSVNGIATAHFSDKNVGSNKAVAVSGYVLQGADAGNYILLQPTNLAANITPAPLAVSGLIAQHRTYDATSNATLTGSASVNALGADVISLSGNAVAVFNDKHVGNDKPVTVSGYVLQGADAGNYSLQQPAGLTANITPATLSVSGVTAQNKVYDATTVATLGGMAVVSPLGVDAVSLTGTVVAAFGDKNVGTAKPVTVAGYALQGADAGNYILQQPTGLVASIVPAVLTVGGVAAQNKTYDASTQATLVGTPSVAALGADVVNISGAAMARFSDASVGDNKPVTVSGYTLQGLDAGNYMLQQPSGLTANITEPPQSVVQVRATSLPLPLPPLPVTDVPPREFTWPAPVDRVTLDVSGAFDSNDTNSTTRAPITPFVGEVPLVTAQVLPNSGGEHVFQLPSEVQALLDRAGVQRVAVTGADRTPLPQWLRFDAAGKRLLAHRVPAGALPMTLLITLGDQQTLVKIDMPARLHAAAVSDRLQ